MRSKTAEGSGTGSGVTGASARLDCKAGTAPLGATFGGFKRKSSGSVDTIDRGSVATDETDILGSARSAGSPAASTDEPSAKSQNAPEEPPFIDNTEPRAGSREAETSKAKARSAGGFMGTMGNEPVRLST